MMRRLLQMLAFVLASIGALGAAQARTIAMDHVTVEVEGEGAPLILVPGLSSPRAVWDGVAPALRKTHRLYLVQVNGFAGDDPRGNLKPGILDGIVADLHRIIAEEGLAKPALVGHSMGGLVGLMLAKAHPGDLGKLMVVDAFPWFGVVFGATSVAGIEPQAAAMRDQFAANYGKPAAPNPGLVAQMASKPESRVKVAAWMAATDPRVSAQALYEDMTTDLRGDMAAITTPITLVYPWSAAVPEALAKTMYERAYAAAPAVTFVPVGDSAHFIMLDQPAAFAAALDAFLGR